MRFITSDFTKWRWHLEEGADLALQLLHTCARDARCDRKSTAVTDSPEPFGFFSLAAVLYIRACGACATNVDLARQQLDHPDFNGVMIRKMQLYTQTASGNFRS